MNYMTKKSDTWYNHPAIREDSAKSLDLFTRYKKMDMCEKCIKLDVQFEALFSLIMAYKKVTGNAGNYDGGCICDLIIEAIPEGRIDTIYTAISDIGFENIRQDEGI
jgi:hypothetical protein